MWRVDSGAWVRTESLAGLGARESTAAGLGARVHWRRRGCAGGPAALGIVRAAGARLSCQRAAQRSSTLSEKRRSAEKPAELLSHNLRRAGVRCIMARCYRVTALESLSYLGASRHERRAGGDWWRAPADVTLRDASEAGTARW